MPDTTTRYSWPYQEATDPPDGPALGQDLAEAVETTVGAIDDRLDDAEDDIDLLQAADTALDGRLDVVEPRARGMVYFGQRNSNKATANDTVEVGVVRLDSCLLKDGRNYQIAASGLRVTGATATHFLCKLRYNPSGTATTSSTEVARSEGTTPTDNLPSLVAPIQIVGSDVTASFLLTFQRTAGSGAITLNAENVGSMMITVTDMGPVLSDTGTDV
jgi:hypothetical protein